MPSYDFFIDSLELLPDVSNEVVVSEAGFLVRPDLPVRGMAGLLPQHSCDERYKRFLGSSLWVCVDRWGHFRVRFGARLPAQPVGLSEATRRMGPLFHLSALRHGVPTRVPIESNANSR